MSQFIHHSAILDEKRRENLELLIIGALKIGGLHCNGHVLNAVDQMLSRVQCLLEEGETKLSAPNDSLVQQVENVATGLFALSQESPSIDVTC